jgi:IS4 transposase
MVRDTAEQMAQIIDSTKATLPPLVKGYQVKIVDGSHLRRTQRRIGELRVLNSAPLPGHAVVVLDPQRKIVLDAIPCEDAYAQERTLLPELLETIQAKNLVIADRNFCTMRFLLQIIAHQAGFVIREHGNTLRSRFCGKRKKVAQTDSGIVYEQAIEIEDDEGVTAVIRRVTIELFEKTRNGDSEIHILTNLPPRIGAVRVAELYRHRWKIEHAFLEVQQNLEGEIETLGYPKAALFSHCMALVSYNVMSVLQAALRAAHGTEKIEEEVSVYYVADEIAHTYRGLEIAIPESYWKKQYASLSPRQMARALIAIATQIDLGRYRKHKRGPKKKTEPMNKKYRAHVSTARILAQRKIAVT